MKNTNSLFAGILALILLLTCTACAQNKRPSGTNTTQADTRAGDDVTAEEGNASHTASADTMPSTPEATLPVSGDYAQEKEVLITLSDHGTTAAGDGVEINGNIITIVKSGSYLLSGTLTNGQLRVNTTDEEKVKLYLNGVSITCADGPAVYVVSAPKKVVFCTVRDSVNLLSDGSTDYIVPDEEQKDGVSYPNGTVYAKDDLKFSGEGSLFITGNWGNGVSTSNDLEIAGGTLTVNAKNHGLRGKDSVEINDGTVYVTSGGDAIRSAETEKDGKGFIQISGGALYLTAVGDGISAATDLTVQGGTLVITTTGTKNSSSSSSSSSFGWGRPGGFGGREEGNQNKSATSAKGLKAAGVLTVSGTPHITIDSADDSLHSDTEILINGGTLSLSSADDGIHADKELTVNGGTIEITESYEGLEAIHITVRGGTIRVVASDDGFNACGGTSMGGRPGGFGGRSGQNQAADNTETSSSETPLLTFAGGYTVINAGGDGIDSNGNIVMTGGTVLIYGPTDNGNGAIDFGDGNYNMTISGGTLLAVGSSGMAETATNKGQAVLAFSSRSSFDAGTIISIVDADGNVIFTVQPPKIFASVVFSSADVIAKNSYTVLYGGASTGENTDGVLTGGAHTGYTELGRLEAQ